MRGAAKRRENCSIARNGDSHAIRPILDLARTDARDQNRQTYERPRGRRRIDCGRIRHVSQSGTGLVRRQNLAYGLDVLQLVKAGIELVKPDVAIDQLIDRQTAFLVQAQEPGDVAYRYARPHEAAANGLFIADKVALVEGEGRGRRGKARDHYGPTVLDERISGGHRVYAARQFKRVVDAAAGQIAHLLDAAGLLRAQRMRRANPARHFQLGGVAVERK